MSSTQHYQRIQNLHRSFCALSGQNIPLVGTGKDRTFVWEQFIYAISKYDCTPEKALKIVIPHLQMEIAKKNRPFTCLLFRWTIECPDDFGELLAALLAQRRATRHPDAKAEALKATGRSTEPPTPDAKPVGEIMAQNEKMAAMLGQWRKENLES